MIIHNLTFSVCLFVLPKEFLLELLLTRRGLVCFPTNKGFSSYFRGNKFCRYIHSNKWITN